MKLSRSGSAAAQFAIMLTCGIVWAADPQEKTGAAATTVLPTVEARALRDPVEKSYRKIVNGMDLFERRRSLAPNASASPSSPGAAGRFCRSTNCMPESPSIP